MRRHLTLLATGLALLIATEAAIAQQTPPVLYRTSLYLNVPQDKVPVFLENSRTLTRKYMQERINAGEPLQSWALLAVLYRGSPALEYNYVNTSVFLGPPPEVNPTARDQVVQKATGMKYAEYLQKLISVSTVVGNTLSRVDDSTPGSLIKEGNVISVFRWKVDPQRGADYRDFVRTMLLPVQTQAVKDGAILGWTSSSLVSPGGASMPYNSVVGVVHKDLASALQGGGLGNQARFAKVHPQKNYVAFVDQGRAMRTMVRSELLRAVVVVERPASTATSSR